MELGIRYYESTHLQIKDVLHHVWDVLVEEHHQLIMVEDVNIMLEMEDYLVIRNIQRHVIMETGKIVHIIQWIYHRKQ